MRVVKMSPIFSIPLHKCIRLLWRWQVWHAWFFDINSVASCIIESKIPLEKYASNKQQDCAPCQKGPFFFAFFMADIFLKPIPRTCFTAFFTKLFILGNFAEEIATFFVWKHVHFLKSHLMQNVHTNKWVMISRRVVEEDR